MRNRKEKKTRAGPWTIICSSKSQGSASSASRTVFGNAERKTQNAKRRTQRADRFLLVLVRALLLPAVSSNKIGNISPSLFACAFCAHLLILTHHFQLHSKSSSPPPPKKVLVPSAPLHFFGCAAVEETQRRTCKMQCATCDFEHVINLPFPVLFTVFDL